MDGTAKNLTVLLIYGLLVFGGAGCAKRTQWPKWVPGSIQVEHVPGVVAPGERIESLKALAKTASTMDTAQREQVAQELAAEIRKEEDPILRGEIIHTLSFFPGPTCDSVLRLAVNDPDADIRILVCRIWGKRGDADAAKLLVGMLTSDADKDVRKTRRRWPRWAARWTTPIRRCSWWPSDLCVNRPARTSATTWIVGAST